MSACIIFNVTNKRYTFKWIPFYLIQWIRNIIIIDYYHSSISVIFQVSFLKTWVSSRNNHTKNTTFMSVIFFYKGVISVNVQLALAKFFSLWRYNEWLTIRMGCNFFYFSNILCCYRIFPCSIFFAMFFKSKHHFF